MTFTEEIALKITPLLIGGKAHAEIDKSVVVRGINSVARFVKQHLVL